MSFAIIKKYIEENDTIILYINITNMYAIEIVPHVVNKLGEKIENVFQTQYGALKVMSLIGQQYGSKVNFTKGWGIALHPTPELWTLTLPHRTQILYSTDISMILGCLNVLPGSVVCEAGTGSGSLSHSFLRAIGDTGCLYTADFHDERVEKARNEFAKHGLSSRVIINSRDVYADGWQVTGEADAVFMDLPKPWLALHHAVNAIKMNGGRICSFSPCIEQVSRTCSLMRKVGLQNIKTIEVLLRTLAVKKLKVPNFNSPKNESCTKKPKLEEPQTSTNENHTAEDSKNENSNGENSLTNENGGSTNRPSIKRKLEQYEDRTILTASPILKQAGHTGYLTFCFVPPNIPRPVRFIEIS